MMMMMMMMMMMQLKLLYDIIIQLKKYDGARERRPLTILKT